MDKTTGPTLFSKGALRKKKKCPEITKLQTNVALSKGSEEEGATFEELGLLKWAVEICRELGMKRPTLVQILKGKDVMGLAQTSSDKTIAFALPILHTFTENQYGIFTLVIVAEGVSLSIGRTIPSSGIPIASTVYSCCWGHGHD